MLKGSKQKHEVLRFSSRRETPRSHVLNFRATSGQNVLYMRSDVSKEMSRFRLPSSGRRRLLLKVPILVTGTPLIATTTTAAAADTTTTKAEVHSPFSEVVISNSLHITATKIRKSQTIPNATEVPKTTFKVCSGIFHQHHYLPNFL